MVSTAFHARVALVAMPGGGKSTVGRQLAQFLQVPFVDTDTLIEHQIGMPIKEWFALKGESSFRDIEQAEITHLNINQSMVLATGGGAILREANRNFLRQNFTVIYLHSSPTALYRRLRYDKSRPLLQVTNPFQRLEELYRERDSLYRQASHFVLETGRPSVHTLVHKILMQLELNSSFEYPNHS
jgi:shikimate kinase